MENPFFTKEKNIKINDILLSINLDKQKKNFRINDIKELNFANKEDIVLIAGKGHEDYQILNDKVINFDDRKIAYKLLKEKSKSQ